MIRQIISFILSLFESKKIVEKQEVIKEGVVSEEQRPYLVKQSEILRDVKLEEIPQDHQDNLKTLLEKINKIRYAWGKSMRVTSGYRSMDHHIEIYKDLAKQRKKAFDMTQVPMGSAHLKCAAVDISDPDGSLYDWTHDNEALMEEIGVWMEVKDDQPRVHFQIYPPKSGKRWFSP